MAKLKLLENTIRATGINPYGYVGEGKNKQKEMQKRVKDAQNKVIEEIERRW